MNGYSKHHRRAKINGGDNSNRNCILVPDKLHRAYHLLFGTKKPEEVAKLLTETWVDPDYVLIAVHKEKGISLSEIASIVKPSKNKLNPPPDDYEG